MLIFLIGMMGSGKSTIGKLLAETLQFPFYDTDTLIESIEGQTVSDIFAQKGEGYFRTLEHELISNWKLSHGVVATGGGLPCHNRLMDILYQKGVTIYLESSVEDMVTRIGNDVSRPLLYSKSIQEKQKIIRQILKTRTPIYKLSRLKIKNNSSPEVVVTKIIKKLKKQLADDHFNSLMAALG
ncbi:MAG: shikimate kinase [Saprospiraceae bacterium]